MSGLYEKLLFGCEKLQLSVHRSTNQGEADFVRVSSTVTWIVKKIKGYRISLDLSTVIFTVALKSDLQTSQRRH